MTFKVRDCSLEEEAGCEESVDGVSGKVSWTSETSETSETSTEGRDQKISSRPIPRLFFETKIFETETFF